MTTTTDAREEERIAALEALGILDTPPDDLFEQVVWLTKRRFDVPVVVVPMLDRTRAWFKASCGLPGATEAPREQAFCRYTILGDDVLVVPDTLADPRFAGNAMVVSPPHIRFYAGAPIALEPGLRLGTLCVMDHTPRAFSPEDAEELAAFADLIKGLLQLHEARQMIASELAASEVRRALVVSQANELRRRQAIFAHTERLADVGGWDIDLATGEMSWSDQTFKILEVPREEGAGQDKARAVFAPADLARLQSATAGAIRSGKPFDLEVPLTTQRGTSRWVRIGGEAEFNDGRATRLVGIVKNITERKANEFRMWWLANHDELTGLPNRTLFQERLSGAFKEAKRKRRQLALLLIDVDQFKDVNDTLGHDAGDALLKEVAGRLRRVLPAGSVAARLGGDEFAVLVPLARDERPDPLLDRVIAELRAPVPYLERMLSCRSSIGVTVVPEDGDADSALKNADIALYAAKAQGRDCFARYQPAMRQAMHRRIGVLATVRAALDEDRVAPFYQPKVSLTTGEVVGFEALLRWTHPDRGVQTPSSILDAFDDQELAVAIGKRMLERVAGDMRTWAAEGLPFGHVAVNASASEFRRGGFAEGILDCLDRHGLSSRSFELEVTESVFLGRGAEAVGAALKQLKRRGVAIALDDFGTGYASLTHLKRFPVHWLKIDRSFVKDIEVDAEAAAIVHAVIGLGKSLGLGLVAEGVETPGQLAFLKRRGCDVGQGYLFGKPMAGTRVPAFLARWAPPVELAPAPPLLRIA
jgi:diguanylate cyclase (GGDEF)-like protein